MEERIKKLETITERLMRRAGKRSSAIITPYPISSAMFGDRVEGPILRYMFPCDGTISKCLMKFGSKPKNPVAVKFSFADELSSSSKGLTVEKRMISANLDTQVKAGTCLEVSLVTGNEIVTEFWVSMLWTPLIAEAEIKNFLIEDLENDIQKKGLTSE